MERTQIPFVAWESTKLLGDQGPAPNNRYDPMRQLWIDQKSGQALVSQHAERRARVLNASEFGETLVTRTSEGVDQTEGRPAIDLEGREGLSASEFGETVMTKTSEGVDQSETIALNGVL